jgi:hypothetical protein
MSQFVTIVAMKTNRGLIVGALMALLSGCGGIRYVEPPSACDNPFRAMQAKHTARSIYERWLRQNEQLIQHLCASPAGASHEHVSRNDLFVVSTDTEGVERAYANQALRVIRCPGAGETVESANVPFYIGPCERLGSRATSVDLTGRRR